MEARVRLYKIHDYDLLRYYFSKKEENTPFAKIIKQLLQSYLKGELLKAPRILETVERKFPKKIETTILFSEKSEQEMIDFLNTLAPKQRNSFLRNLLRQGISCKDMVLCYQKVESNTKQQEKVHLEDTPKQMNKKNKEDTIISKDVVPEKKEESFREQNKVENHEEKVSIAQSFSEESTQLLSEEQNFSDNYTQSSTSNFDFFGAMKKIIDNS